MCYSSLSPLSRLTYDAIIAATQEPRYAAGVPPLALVPYLRMPNTMERMNAFIRDLVAHRTVILSPKDLEVLTSIAMMTVDDSRQGLLKDHANRLATAEREIPLKEVVIFNEVMQYVYAQRIQKRVDTLRKELKNCTNPGCARETVTRAPYLIVRPAAESTPRGNFEALYWLLQRPAWWEALGLFEEESVVIVHRRYRCALRIGVAMHDDCSIAGACTPLREVISPELRSALELTVRYSEWFQNLFNSFYEPELCPGDYRYVMRRVARPHATEVILVLTALRNAITQVVNDLVKPHGFSPIRLGQGCGWFPRHPVWVPCDGLPSGPILLPPDELAARAEALLQIGLDIRYEGRERFLGHGAADRVVPFRRGHRPAPDVVQRAPRQHRAAAAANDAARPRPRRRRNPLRGGPEGNDAPRSLVARRGAPRRGTTRRRRPRNERRGRGPER